MGKIVTKEYDDDEMFKSSGPVFAVYAAAYKFESSISGVLLASRLLLP